MGISLERFIEVSKQLYERSLSLGIPAISYEDGLVLASLALIYCAANSTMRAVDTGAGIGYSTIFLAYGMGQRCRGGLTAIENREERFNELMSNLPLLREIAGDGIEIEVIYGDALEYLRGIEDGSLDLAFIDIEKGSYPQALKLLRKKLRKEGIAIFHNAISPKPLVPRWSLIVIDINLFVLLCFLTHRDVITSLWSSRDFHLPHGDMDIPMGSLMAVEPSGTGLPSMLKNPKPFWAEPS